MGAGGVVTIQHGFKLVYRAIQIMSNQKLIPLGSMGLIFNHIKTTFFKTPLNYARMTKCGCESARAVCLPLYVLFCVLIINSYTQINSR